MKVLDTLPTDFCSLPIIVGDEAMYCTASQSQGAEGTFLTDGRGEPNGDRLEEGEQEEEREGEEGREDGEGEGEEEDLVENIADAILEAAETAWLRFSSSITGQIREVCTSKVRAVCLEVLKRTDDSPLLETAPAGFAYDDDARFLD